MIPLKRLAEIIKSAPTTVPTFTNGLPIHSWVNDGALRAQLVDSNTRIHELVYELLRLHRICLELEHLAHQHLSDSGGVSPEYYALVNQFVELARSARGAQSDANLLRGPGTSSSSSE